MKIDNDLLKKLEKLSSLEIASDKREGMINQLSEIVEFIENLNELYLDKEEATFTTVKGESLKVYQAKLINYTGKEPSGTIIMAKKQLIIKAKNNAVELLEIQKKGKRKLKTLDFSEAITTNNACDKSEEGTLRYVSGTSNPAKIEACLYTGSGNVPAFEWKPLTQ